MVGNLGSTSSTATLPAQAQSFTMDGTSHQRPNYPNTTSTATLLSPEAQVFGNLDTSNVATPPAHLANFAMDEISHQRPVTFSMTSYKAHAFGDYFDTIKEFGTTDSYSTEAVSRHLSHTFKFTADNC